MNAAEALQDEAYWFGKALMATPPKGLTESDIRLRMHGYEPRVKHGLLFHYTCPKCWIRDQQRPTLRSVHGTDDYDVLKCNSDACATEFIIPFE